MEGSLLSAAGKTATLQSRESMPQASFGRQTGYMDTKVNAFGQPVDDMIEIGDILKVSVHENSTRPPLEQVVIHNIKAPEMVNKKEPFSLEKLSKLNTSITAPVKYEESALLGKRGSVLQENEAPGRT